MRVRVGVVVWIALIAGGAGAQQFSMSPCNGDTNSGGWFSNAQVCEMRRTTFAPQGRDLSVYTANGSVAVEGQDRRDIALEARVTAQGRTTGDAERILHEIEISTGHEVRVTGPTGISHGGWGVSLKLLVPRQLAANLKTSNGAINAAMLEGNVEANTSNGAITLNRVQGNVAAHSTNGALHLTDVNGAVEGTTSNGGVSIVLGPNHAGGAPVSVHTSNGGVSLKVPAALHAHLDLSTSNGGISVGLPVQLPEHIGHQLNIDLNGGGAPVQVQTTNGGINVSSL